MRLIWTRPSIRDLVAVESWLSDHASGDIADQMLAQIQIAATRLLDFPRLGPAVGDQTGARTLSVRRTPFILLYTVDTSAVHVLRVHHAREDWRTE